MKTITYESQEEQDKTVSAFLMKFLEYAQDIGLFVQGCCKVMSSNELKRKSDIGIEKTARGGDVVKVTETN